MSNATSPLPVAVPQYFSQKAGADQNYKFFYTTTYHKNDQIDSNDFLMTDIARELDKAQEKMALFSILLLAQEADPGKEILIRSNIFATAKVINSECSSGDAPNYCRTYFESADSSNPVDLNTVLNTAPVNILDATELNEFAPIVF